MLPQLGMLKLDFLIFDYQKKIHFLLSNFKYDGFKRAPLPHHMQVPVSDKK